MTIHELAPWIWRTAFLLLTARWLVELWLAYLNERHVRARGDAVPETLAGVVDETTYHRAVRYTLAKGRFSRWADTYDVLVLALVLFTGVLAWSYDMWQGVANQTVWAQAFYLFLVATILSLLSWPFSWYSQFHLEERFDFNTTTPKLWIIDRIKGLLLSLALGYPLLAVVLVLAEKSGTYWWLWAWLVLVSFQLVMSVLAPVLILPLFNRFTPLPDGELRDRLFDLAKRTDFAARDIFIMDGSRRSKHSNAFFTGLGRYRRIILFDTLVNELTPPELEAVLAHEIGHFRKRHVLVLFGFSSLASLVAFALIGWLAQVGSLALAFGFDPASGALLPTLLLTALLAGTVTFWFSPLMNRLARAFEFQADRFAAQAMGEWESLTEALRKLNRSNLSNFTPHPLYSAVYYSHPALLEREQALRSAGISDRATGR